MPHATEDHEAQEQADEDDLYQRALDFNNPLDLGDDFHTRDLEGEKADDAVDFGDLSDDDLADDEDAAQSFGNDILATINGDPNTAGFAQDADFGKNEGNVDLGDFDDLFGDGPPSPDGTAIDDSLAFNLGGAEDTIALEQGQLGSSSPFSPSGRPEYADLSGLRSARDPSKEATLSKEQQLQQKLFAMSRSGTVNLETIPHPPENADELLASLWPKFQRDTVPKFLDLLNPRRARHQGKVPPKPPKPFQGTKLNLELTQDQERGFKVSSGTGKRTREEVESAGIIAVEGETTVEKSSDGDVDLNSDYENDTVKGISWQDLQILCEDWDVHSLTDSLSSAECMLEQEQETDMEWPVAKRRKRSHLQRDLLHDAPIDWPSLHDPEGTTAKIARKITLDLNDSRLLIDHLQPSISPKPSVGFRNKIAAAHAGLSQGLSQKYNISNDEAYDLLKENHQHKIRGTLGNPTIEHSLPAVRLQWPFYKTKLEKQEARSFHRPPLRRTRREHIMFSKPRHISRKTLKGRSAHNIYATTEDLSLGDNSTVLLLEYSEEHPPMMSNTGMGNRIINYYRRKNMEDLSRPKLDIGDLAVLLPQDKSPFSLFGHIDPGEITPALYNGMYRAPIFQQEAKKTDFLVIRSSTGVQGSKWFMRNIDNIRVVGQEFPSVDIPGPHSRKVTTASKNRLKMISYRLVRRTKHHRISVGEVTKHFIDTNDMQNRQKMKEFMQFDKDYKEWRMRPGETVPDEDVVRSMVKPEDVCLLESMQIGQQHLQDAGFSKEDDNSEDDEAKEGQNIEQQLAPWCTSRNFLHATQGKAMLELHGDGDPSARGEAFSFIKTSMKGGFRAIGESVQDKLLGKRMKEFQGHSYNVQRQQMAYDESIRRIWDAQKRSLSTTLEQSDSDADDDEMLEASDAPAYVDTPRSEIRTPHTLRRREDEAASQSSQLSSRSQAGKILEITRQVRDKYGNVETIKEVVRNPRVIRQYLKRRHAQEAEATQLSEIVPTGDSEADKRNQLRLQKELDRLKRNQERRIAREKQKGIVHTDGTAEEPATPGSPGTPASAVPKSTGTLRKCANCGQVGHIKTNKKLCPMLNGTMKPEEGFSDSAFTANAPIL